MSRITKDAQLQIRVSGHEKAAIQQAAHDAGMEMSAYVLSRVLPASGARFAERVAACAESASSRHALAELNSFLSALTAQEFRDAVNYAPTVALTPFISNYVAAMVEYGCGRLSVPVPSWTRYNRAPAPARVRHRAAKPAAVSAHTLAGTLQGSQPVHRCNLGRPSLSVPPPSGADIRRLFDLVPAGDHGSGGGGPGRGTRRIECRLAQRRGEGLYQRARSFCHLH